MGNLYEFEIFSSHTQPCIDLKMPGISVQRWKFRNITGCHSSNVFLVCSWSFDRAAARSCYSYITSRLGPRMFLRSADFSLTQRFPIKHKQTKISSECSHLSSSSLAMPPPVTALSTHWIGRHNCNMFDLGTEDSGSNLGNSINRPAIFRVLNS
jgi:hypothetical protein